MCYLCFSVKEVCLFVENHVNYSCLLSFLCNVCYMVDLAYVSGMIVTSALIIWKALMCITGSESPVVVVLSGSMEPGFKRVG